MVEAPCPGPSDSVTNGRGGGGGALEGKGLQRRPQNRLGMRLSGVAKAVGGGYCRLQMLFKLALVARETVAGHRLGAFEGGGGLNPPPFQCIPGGLCVPYPQPHYVCTIQRG